MTAPLIIQAVSLDGNKTFYAISQTIPASNVVNVTSITDSLARASGSAPSTLFADPVATLASVDFAKLKTAQDNLKTALDGYLKELGVASSADLTTTAFSADNSKVDALLDCLSSVSGVLSVKAACTGGAAVPAFDPAVNATTVPAKLAAPAVGSLGYLPTNLPLINAQIKLLSNAWNGTSGDLATVLAANFDAGGSYDNGMGRAAWIAEQVGKFNAGERMALYSSVLVGFDSSANTVDMCVDGAYTESGKTVAETTGWTFKKINGVWQVTTESLAARLACEKHAFKVTVRAVSAYGTTSGPLVSSLYSSYAVCIGKAPQKAVGATLSADEHCAAAGVPSSTFDVSSWIPASGKVALVAYIKSVSDNKVFSTIDSGSKGLASNGNLNFTNLNICAKSATADSVNCSITTLY